MFFSPQRTLRTRRTLLNGSIFVSLVSFVVASAATTVVASAAKTPQEMYFAAMAREQTVRVVLAQDDTPASVAADVRAVVAAYQEIVRVHPASGYSDNALWQAGCLSIDVFLRFGEERDKNLGLRLLKLLTAEYPTSSRVKDVPDEIARVDVASAGGPKDPPQPPSPEGAALPPPSRTGAALPPPSRVATATQGGPTSSTAGLATITEIRREVLADAVRVTIELDHEVTFHDERIPDPVRVFVDLPSTRVAPALRDKTLRFEGDNDIVRQIRIGRHPNAVTRVVLDAAGTSSYSVYPLYDPYRLVIDCVREPRSTSASAAPLNSGESKDPPLQTSTVSGELDGSPLPLSPAGTGLRPTPTSAPAAAAATPPPVPATDALPPLVSTSAPPKNAGGGYSLARQLGLSVSRIVIDPGHGGHDPGATGKSITEADLVLDIALRVETLLLKMPGTEVILTRRTDEFVPLQERTAIANREGADLFLSIHANANANAAAHGVETYFLNFASNLTAASVAARENAASGQSMGALPDFLKAIAFNNKLDESRDFANEVQRAIVERLRKSNKTVKDLGVKQAPFVVLIGAAMPSVLAEISFLTNAPEAKLLRGSAYRQRIAEALASAIGKYQRALKNVPTVAQQ
jgi:N-acetylmuramoyl-L-alanine amidase